MWQNIPYQNIEYLSNQRRRKGACIQRYFQYLKLGAFPISHHALAQGAEHQQATTNTNVTMMREIMKMKIKNNDVQII